MHHSKPACAATRALPGSSPLASAASPLPTPPVLPSRPTLPLGRQPPEEGAARLAALPSREGARLPAVNMHVAIGEAREARRLSTGCALAGLAIKSINDICSKPAPLLP